MTGLRVEFCGEWHEVPPGAEFFVGRGESDLVIDDNPYLHRRFLRLSSDRGIWWLTNTGNLLSATVTAADGLVQAWLSPGAALPIVFPRITVVFTAGPTTYDFSIHSDDDYYSAVVGAGLTIGSTTIDPVALTPSQRLLVIALCEHMLRRDRPGRVEVPTNAEVAARLGWPITTYNRKLDYVCEKLDKLGVPGLRGEKGRLASKRRDRLVEYAMTSRMVSPEDLALLDLPHPEAEIDDV
jgi:hypothetical protein